MHSLKKSLIRYAQSLGFERVGVTSADPAVESSVHFEKWIQDDRAGDMDYLKRDPAQRAVPKTHLSEARSVIALAVNYRISESPRPPSEGRIAAYALGRDYHTVLRKRLDSFVRYAESLVPGSEFRTFVDTGPLLERAFAQRAGLGFIGKNTMLITRGLGSWVFLAQVVTTLELPLDAPDTRTCGECRLCIEACPTDALATPYSLDARRCISYLTIELKGAVPAGLRSKTSGWLLGCDICQDVCPHNTRVPVAPLEAFSPQDASRVTLRQILEMTDSDVFQRTFDGSPLKRPGLEGLQRNACLAAAHLRRGDLFDPIRKLAATALSPNLREVAAWAANHLESTLSQGGERPSIQ